ncbi:MAG: AI-2E family transporter [Saccharospirillum sp.]|nr:AI-2E family transporter [Saccharospirillum sp.]
MSQNTQESLVAGARVASQPSPGYRSKKRLFNSFELRLFRYTLVLLSLVVLTALILIILWSFGLFLKIFYSLLLSLSIAGILALVLYPVVDFLQNRIHMPRLLSIVLLLVALSISIGGLIFLLVPILVRQIVQLMTVLPETLASWQAYFAIQFPGISAMIADNMENSNGEESQSILPGLEDSGRTLLSYLSILVGISFVPLFLFFALLSGNALRGKVSELLSIFHQPTQKKALYFMDVFVGYVTAFFQGQLMIAICMGALYALGFSLVGLEFGVLVGLILGMLNIVPFLGSLIGLLVVLPMAYFQVDGGMELLVFTALVFAVVQMVESGLLTPNIMANRSGLHPAVVIISLFFWGTAFNGIIGLVLAVPLTAFFVAIWGEIKYSLETMLSNRDTTR